jgi:hypothetical protein
MDAFRAYKYYLAVKLHFTTDKYNVFESGGNVKGSRQAFDQRNDSYIFRRMASKFSTDKDLIQYYVANFAYGNKEVVWNDDEYDNYELWLKRKQSISQVFIDDLATMLTNIENNSIISDRLFNFGDGENPIALNLFLSGKIAIETLRIIDDIHPIVGAWKKSPSSFIWEDDMRRIEKLKGFVKYNESKIRQIWAHFTEELSEL